MSDPHITDPRFAEQIHKAFKQAGKDASSGIDPATVAALAKAYSDSVQGKTAEKAARPPAPMAFPPATPQPPKKIAPNLSQLGRTIHGPAQEISDLKKQLDDLRERENILSQQVASLTTMIENLMPMVVKAAQLAESIDLDGDTSVEVKKTRSGNTTITTRKKSEDPEMRSDLIDIECIEKHRTHKGVLINDGTKDVWLPLSKVEIVHNKANGLATVTLPQWLAEEKELV